LKTGRKQLLPIQLGVLLFEGLLWIAAPASAADPVDEVNVEDTPLENLLEYPGWFKQSFLELDEDLK